MKINSLKFNNSTIHKMYHGDELVNKIGDAFTYMEASGDTPTPPTPVPYDEQYLTIESLEDNNSISWYTSYTGIAKTISVSIDNGITWTEYLSSRGGTTIATLNTGDKVLVKGTNAQYASNSSNYNRFLSNSSFIAYGNIMSLISGDSFVNADTLTGTYTFAALFREATGLTSAENLILPATTLANGCYNGMFSGCRSLTTAPKLPATTLADSCYRDMFNVCTSLTSAPELPATSLANSCYNSMFNGCTSLTVAPELPATTLILTCYRYMFWGCSRLNNIKCLATNISASNCTYNWVNGVAASGTFIKADGMNNWTRNYNGIPPGWTVQNDR